MSRQTKTEAEARRLCTHTIVYTEDDDILVAVRAMQGRSTKAIAAELGLTQSKVQYRVSKSQNSMGLKFRSEYRNGTSALAKRMMKATERIGLVVVRDVIAPKFTPLARPGVPRK